MWLSVGLPNFIWMGRSVTELWCHIDLPRWRPRRRKSTSGFLFGDVSHLRRSKTIRVLNFAAKISQSTVKILLLLVFWKQTTAILKFYIWFSFWPFPQHRHVFLLRPTKRHLNGTIGNKVMTSYRFSKMTATASEIYFRVPVWWRLPLE